MTVGEAAAEGGDRHRTNHRKKGHSVKLTKLEAAKQRAERVNTAIAERKRKRDEKERADRAEARRVRESLHDEERKFRDHTLFWFAGFLLSAMTRQDADRIRAMISTATIEEHYHPVKLATLAIIEEKFPKD